MADPVIFWDVDTQRDFMDRDGKLYVPGAETIVPKLKRLTDWARKRGVTVVASVDAHGDANPEFAQYGPHCQVGTPGQEKIPETRLPDAFVIPNRKIELPRDLSAHKHIVIEKDALDVFTNPNTESLLERLKPAREIVLYGVVTEICVAFAARGLIKRGFPVRCVSDAIRALDESSARAFLDEIARLGAKLQTTDEVIADLERVRAA